MDNDSGTLAYYDREGAAFCGRTVALDMEAAYGRFLPLLPAGGTILDAGCGSGRDSRAFLMRGYAVTSIDGSQAMVEATSALTGREATRMRFDEMPYVEAFDGIWACASVLHVPSGEMASVWSRFARALKPGGVWYVSYKHGTGQRERDGRVFTDMDEAGLAGLVRGRPELEAVDVWVTEDVRADRSSEKWLNAVLRRAPLPRSEPALPRTL